MSDRARPHATSGAASRATLVAVVLVLGTAAGLTLLFGSRGGGDGVDARTASRDVRVRRFCGLCHAFPEPSLLPRDRWPAAIDRMIALYATDTGTVLPATRDECRAFYAAASVTLDVHPTPVVDALRDGRPLGVPLPADAGAIRALTSGAGPVFAAAARGVFRLDDGVRVADVSDGVALASLRLDGDTALAVAVEGGSDRADHDRGQVVRVRRPLDRAPVTEVVLSSEGRMADTAVLDVRRDGDDDVIVAVRGYFRTGGLRVLESDSGGVLEAQTLDPRRAVRLLVADLDGDGLRDLVAALGGQFQAVVAFYSDPSGGLVPTTLFDAGNPCFGITSLDVGDVDGDGDVDIVLTAGDAGPDSVIQPFHGVHLLRASGSGRFDAERLAVVPRAADVRLAAGRAFVRVDGTGDLLVLDPGRPATRVERIATDVTAIASRDVDGARVLVAAFSGEVRVFD